MLPSLHNISAVKALSRAPVLLGDGTCVQGEGYHGDEKVFLDYGGANFGPVPENMSWDEAHAALEEFLSPLREYVFCNGWSRSVAVAAMLTPLVRPAVDAAPLFAIVSREKGTGKSKIANCAAVLATGKGFVSVPFAADDDENRKKLFAYLRCGASVLCFDNVSPPRKLGGDSLCTVLVEREYSDRVLGKSEVQTVPNSSTLFATGNNLDFGDDVTRRVLACDIDPAVENPCERRFEFDPVRETRERRAELVPLGLGILRAYMRWKAVPRAALSEDDLARRDRIESLSAFGSFEQWSAMVREPLVWLGMDDPLDSRAYVRDHDVPSLNLGRVLQAVKDRFGLDDPKTCQEMLAGSGAIVDERHSRFLAELEEALPFRRSLDAKSLGYYFRSVKGRICGGLKLEDTGKAHAAVLWAVKETAFPGKDV